MTIVQAFLGSLVLLPLSTLSFHSMLTTDGSIFLAPIGLAMLFSAGAVYSMIHLCKVSAGHARAAQASKAGMSG